MGGHLRVDDEHRPEAAAACDLQGLRLLLLADARKAFGFEQPAIEVASSEGSHQARSSWNAQVEADLCERLLDGLAPRAR